MSRLSLQSPVAAAAADDDEEEEDFLQLQSSSVALELHFLNYLIRVWSNSSSVQSLQDYNLSKVSKSLLKIYL